MTAELKKHGSRASPMLRGVEGGPTPVNTVGFHQKAPNTHRLAWQKSLGANRSLAGLTLNYRDGGCIPGLWAN